MAAGRPVDSPDAPSPEPPRYQRVGAHPFRVLGGEGVLVRLDVAEVVGVSSTGAFLLQALGEPRTETELAARLADEFEVDAQTALRDVREFLEAMRAADLVSLVGA